MNMAPERRHTRMVKYREYVERRLLASMPSKKPAAWTWEFKGQSGAVFAHTRSEAKARVKDALSIKKLTGVTIVARAE